MTNPPPRHPSLHADAPTRTAERMRAVARAAAGILLAHDLEALQDVLRDACAQVVPFDYFNLALYDASTRTLRFPTSSDGGVRVPARTLPVAGTAAERVLASRASHLVHSSAEAAGASVIVGTGRRSESIIRTPILGNDAPLGILTVQSYTPGLYGTEDVEVLETIGSLAATALHNLELLEQKRVSETTALQNEARYRSLVQNARDLVTLVAADGTVLYESPAVRHVLGYEPDDVTGRSVFEFLHPADVPAALASFQAIVENSKAGSLTARFRARSGDWRWLESIGVNLLHDPAVNAVIVNSRDVTDRRYAEERLHRHAAFRETLIAVVEASLEHGLDESFYERLLSNAVEVIPGAEAGSLLVKSESGRYRFAAVVGFDITRLEGVELDERELTQHPGLAKPQLVYGFADNHRRLDTERHERIYASGPTDAIQVTLSVPIVIDGQNEAYFNLDAFESRDAFDDDAVDMARLFASQAAALLRRFRLEGALERERSAFEHLAFHDPLTGLPNRTLLHDRINQALLASRRSGRSIAVMLLDLDDFKHVNDLYGHDVGDGLLREVAARLQRCVRSGDTVARLGGDEFVVLLVDLADPEGAAVVAQKALEALRPAVDLDGRSLRCSSSIGIETFPGFSNDAHDLLKNADVALYRAKAAGKDAYRFFTHEMNERLEIRKTIEADLRVAIAKRELCLHFQPRVVLRTGSIASFEALARWEHPVRGFVPPGEFIPLAEETGLIRELGVQVLHLACSQARAWRDAGTPYRIAVNLSVKQLQQGDIVETVRSALERYGIDGSLLELEVTESAAMTDVDVSVERLRALRALGVTLSLDDFGTAYSSLNYLRRLPIDRLKIDQSFVRGLADDPGERPHEAGIAQAIVALGDSLGLTVVAEGVETAAQAHFLKLLGCEEAQGYYFRRPVPAGEATRLAVEGRIRFDA